MKNFVLGIVALFSISISTQAQGQITIAAARAQATGSVTVKGIVTNGAEFGNARYIQDATGGLTLYGNITSGLSTAHRGDTVLATGTLSEYNNLLEASVTGFTASSILSSNNPMPLAPILTVSQLDETYEAQLIEIDGCTFANGGTAFAGNTNYNVTSGGQTFQIRINIAASTLVGALVPSGTVNLRGILSQFCSSPSSGCTSGYQLLLRDTADIINNASVYLTSPITTANITTTSFDVNWETNVAGTQSFVKYGLTQNLELGNSNANNATSHTSNISGLTPGTIYYAQVVTYAGTDSTTSSIKVFCTQSLSSGKMTTYFDRDVDTTVSTGVNAIHLNGLICDTLAAYINRCKSTLDCAIYDWDTNPSQGVKILQAINAAKARGVKVRFIYDGSTNNTSYQYFNSTIPVMSTPQGSDYTIMHNKFVIIDAHSSNPNDAILWTGSTNWSYNQVTFDANNVIIFQDQSIAKGYKLEFDEMWGDTVYGGPSNLVTSKYGQFKKDNTPHEYVINGKRVESYFSPSDQTNSHLLATIGTANTDLYFATMLITRTDVGNKIVSQVNLNGLNNGNHAIGLIDDTSGTTAVNIYNNLHTTLGNNFQKDSHSWIMHHKYLIVDNSNVNSDPLVFTGSHNWSTGADTKNDENTVIVHDATIANQYYQEFHQRWIERNDPNAGAICSIPLGQGIGEITNTSANIHWAAIAGATSYILQYKDSSSFDWISITTTDTSYLVSGLIINTKYNYRVFSICPLGQSMPAMVKSFVTNTTGIHEIGLNTISISPNPNNGNFFIYNNVKRGNLLSIKLYDIAGRECYSEAKNVNTPVIEINTHNLKAGVYTLCLSNNNINDYKKIVIE